VAFQPNLTVNCRESTTVPGENEERSCKVIPMFLRLLNEQLTSELTAINQYFLHSKMQENWGFTELAGHTRAESFDEMRHAEAITDRILLLDGLPNYQRPFLVAHRSDAARAVRGRPGDRIRRAEPSQARCHHVPREAGTRPAPPCWKASSPTRKTTSTTWRPSWS